LPPVNILNKLKSLNRLFVWWLFSSQSGDKT
jgi:hypothetical protein